MNSNHNHAAQEELKPRRDLNWGEVCGSGEIREPVDHSSLADDEEKANKPSKSHTEDLGAHQFKRKERPDTMSERQPSKRHETDHGGASTSVDVDDEDDNNNFDYENLPFSTIWKHYWGSKGRLHNPRDKSYNTRILVRAVAEVASQRRDEEVEYLEEGPRVTREDIVQWVDEVAQNLRARGAEKEGKGENPQNSQNG